MNPSGAAHRIERTPNEISLSWVAETHPARNGPSARPTSVVARKNVAVATPRMRGRTSAWLVAAAAVLIASPAAADRPPTADERQRIEVELRKLGFTSWGDIELDDGHWEVDNAIDQGGAKYDLELDPATLAVVKRDRD